MFVSKGLAIGAPDGASNGLILASKGLLARSTGGCGASKGLGTCCPGI